MGTATDPGVATVGRAPKKDKAGQPALPKQYNIKLDAATAARVDSTADALGLDGANFLRMLIRESLATYEQRADRVRKGLPAPD